MSWCFWLGAFYMFLLTNWLNQKEWMTIMIRVWTGIIISKIIPRVGWYVVLIITLFLAFNFRISQKTEYLLGMTFMFFLETIIANNKLKGEYNINNVDVIRSYISKFARKKFMRIQYFLIIIITTVFVFVLK